METCFVIMPIGKGDQQRNKWREIFGTIFRQSVQASRLGLKCERADDIHESGSIMKQVLLQLDSAKVKEGLNVSIESGCEHSVSAANQAEISAFGL